MPPKKPRVTVCEACGTRSSRIGNKVRKFMAQFPLDEDRCRLWVKRVGKEDLVYIPIEKLHELKYVCGMHFDRKSFNEKGNRLNKSAIPSKNLPCKPLPEEMLVGFPCHVWRDDSTNTQTHLGDVAESASYVPTTKHFDHTYYKRGVSTTKGVRFSDTVAALPTPRSLPAEYNTHVNSDEPTIESATVPTEIEPFVSEPPDKDSVAALPAPTSLPAEYIVHVNSGEPTIEAATVPTEIEPLVSEPPDKGTLGSYKIVIREVNQNDIVHVAMTQADLNPSAEDLLAVEREHAMEVDQDEDGGVDVPCYDDGDAPIVPARITQLLAVTEDAASTETPPEETALQGSTQSAQETKTDEADTTLYHDQCRCCLKKAAHDTVDIEQALECFNIQVSNDSRMSRQLCAACGEFLQQARRFRDMVVASQITLLSQLDTDCDINSEQQQAYGDDAKQELLKIEDDPELSGEIAVVPEQEISDNGRLHERGSFSQLTDYSDMLMDTKENYKSCTSRDLAKDRKRKREELSNFIRENLITILDNSTLLPFISVTGVKFDCIYCELSYPHIEQLRTHVEEQHRNEETSFQHDILKLLPETLLFADISVLRCRLCDETFMTIDKLVEHLVGVHEKKYHNLTWDPPHNIISFNFGLHIWKCLECETTLPDYKKLRLHVIKHYGTYLCHQCGSKFLYDKHYHQHILTHKNINQNKRTCEICGQSFKNKRLLLYHHYRNHYNITADRLKRDMTQALEPADKEEVVTVVYACSICQNGTSFTDLHAAYMHRIGHLNNTREGPFICEICKYSSSVKKDFRVHLQAHYGIKNYVCEVCKKTFRKSSQLSDHMNSHLNLRFPCPLCDSIFYNKNELIYHVKNQHPDVTVEFSL